LNYLPSGITSLGDGSFARCKEITIEDLPVGLTYLPNQCFASCPKIKITNIATDNDRDFLIDTAAFLAAARNVTSLSFGKGVKIVDIAED
jgi:hypothetical protein